MSQNHEFVLACGGNAQKFVVGDLARTGSSEMQLDELSNRNMFDKVSVDAK